MLARRARGPGHVRAGGVGDRDRAGHPVRAVLGHLEGVQLLGNFVTINELLKDWPGEVLRFNMLRSHYRQPMDWTVAGMNESWKTLERSTA